MFLSLFNILVVDWFRVIRGLVNDISESRQHEIGKRRFLLVVDPPAFGSRESVGDENMYFNVFSQTAISNARAMGRLRVMGVGVGVGPKTRSDPSPCLTPRYPTIRHNNQ